jgi:WD40 repeat protein
MAFFHHQAHQGHKESPRPRGVVFVLLVPLVVDPIAEHQGANAPGSPPATELRRFTGHTDSVWSVAFSPDGQQAISGSYDRTLRLWDVATGRELRRFEGHTGAVLSVAFSKGGQVVVSGSADQTVRIWDVASGKEVRVLHGHQGAVNAVALSPDGRMVLSGGADRVLRLWDRASGAEKRRLKGHGDWVWSAAFSPDGKRALSGSADRTMKLWDVKTGKEVRTFGGHYGAVTSVAFSPDGKRALSGSADGSVRLWDVGGSGQLLRRLVGHKGPVYTVAFVRPGKKMTVPLSSKGQSPFSQAGPARYALSAGADKTLRLWDLGDEQSIEDRRRRGYENGWPPEARGEENLVRRFVGHTAAVYSIALSPDGHTALSGGRDTTLRLWVLP